MTWANGFWIFISVAGGGGLAAAIWLIWPARCLRCPRRAPWGELFNFLCQGCYRKEIQDEQTALEDTRWISL